MLMATPPLSRPAFVLPELARSLPFWEPLRRVGRALLTPLLFSIRSGHFRSSLHSLSMDGSGRPIPWYIYPAIEFLSRQDFSSKRVLEFGGGQSTCWWAERTREVVTIEEDARWCDTIRKVAPANVCVHHVPLDTRERNISAIRSLLATLGQFDVIVVHGHLKLECGRLAFEHLAPRGAVVFDNAEWPSLKAIIRTKKSVPFHGYVPGVHRMQDRTVAFEDDCFLFD